MSNGGIWIQFVNLQFYILHHNVFRCGQQTFWNIFQCQFGICDCLKSAKFEKCGGNMTDGQYIVTHDTNEWPEYDNRNISRWNTIGKIVHT